MMGTWRSFEAVAVPSSASGWRIPCTPIGAKSIGDLSLWPKRVVWGPNVVTQIVTQNETGWYLQVAGSGVSQHAGNDSPFIESLAVGFIGLPRASASENIHEST